MNSLLKKRFNNGFSRVAEGKELQLEHCIEKTSRGIAIKGDMFQKQYEGYNLIDCESLLIDSTVANGLNYVNNGDGTYNINGTSTASKSKVLATLDTTLLASGKKYKLFTSQPYDATTFNICILVKYVDNSLTYITPNGSSLIKELDISTVVMQFYANEGVTIDTATNVKTMLYEYTDGDLEYEPYCGGTPSPNPDYPQEVECVSGEVAINVHNKNIFDINEFPFISKLCYPNGVETWWSGYFGIRKYFPIKSEKTYVFSGDVNKITYIAFYNKNKELISYRDASFNVFTTPKGCAYIRFSVQSSIQPEWIQIEEASTATNYTEHQSQLYPLSLSNIELYGIEGARDCFIKKGEDWYIRRWWQKKVLDGTEKWESTTAYTGFYRFAARNILDIGANGIGVVSKNGFNTHFKQRINQSHSGYEYLYIQQYSSGCMVYIQIEDKTTVEEFKNWLVEQYDNGIPVVIYYQLDESADELITDELLIQQLNELDKALIYNNDTYIDSTSDNLQPIIEVNYNSKEAV